MFHWGHLAALKLPVWGVLITDLLELYRWLASVEERVFSAVTIALGNVKLTIALVLCKVE